MNALVVSVITGALGMGYLVYGRRQARIAPVVAGVLLCVYPYFLDSLPWLVLIGVVLAAVPFLVDW